MLTAEPSFERVALSRVTFGPRDVDVAYVQSIGWAAYVDEQLNPPAGDDDALAAHLAAQTMHITYRATDTPQGGWGDVDEDRPLNYLNAGTEELFNVALQAGKTLPFAEQARIQQELAAASWIRGAHATYQIREFLVDFWHNHFNIGRKDNQFASATLPVYDREHIRPHALGNFREMLEANAMSTSMLLYLDNAVSGAAVPNENYAREVLELHTMGAGAYLGVGSLNDISPVGLGSDIGVKAPGFMDEDVIQASRALSGWTVEFGQPVGPFGQRLPVTGEFIYNPLQHNTQAQAFLGVGLENLTDDMEQGRKVLEIAALHPATAEFICGKLVRRIFGDAPPADVLARAVETWIAAENDDDQIKQVMEAILLGGPEIGELPQLKIRRPFERLMAMFRATETVVNAHPWMTFLLESLNDGLFNWPAPNGRPDVNGYWLSTTANLTPWNLMLQLPYLQAIQTSVAAQTPDDIKSSATRIVEYWVDRMIGYEIAPAAMNTLIEDVTGPAGVLTALNFGKTQQIEAAFARLVGLIATTEEFSYR